MIRFAGKASLSPDKKTMRIKISDKDIIKYECELLEQDYPKDFLETASILELNFRDPIIRKDSRLGYFSSSQSEDLIFGYFEYSFSNKRNKKNITIGKSSIVFQPTTTKKLAMVGSISSLLFLGLEELDLNRLTESEIEKIINLLKKEDQNNLKHDLKLAPARISDFVIKNFLKQTV